MLLLVNAELVVGFPLGGIHSGSFKITWFVTAYLIGGYLRLSCPAKYCRMYCKRIIVFLVSSIALYTCAALFGHDIIALGYNSLLTVAIACCLFMLVMSVKIERSKIISFLAPNVLAVYIIHQHLLMRSFLSSSLQSFIPGPSGMKALYLLFCTVDIFILCVLIDKWREWLFRTVHVENCIDYLSDRIKSLSLKM